MDYKILFGVAFIATAVAVVARITIPRFRHAFCVPEGRAGLLYHHGLYVRRHNAGCQIVWGWGWTMTLVDLRRKLLVVAAKAVLTADRIGVGVNLCICCQITDPAKAMHETQNWLDDIRHAAQFALQLVVNQLTLDALPAHRQEMADQIAADVQAKVGKDGITVHAAQINELFFPAERNHPARLGLT